MGNDPQPIVIWIYAIGLGLAVLLNCYAWWRLIFKELRRQPGELESRPRDRKGRVNFPAAPGLADRPETSTDREDRDRLHRR
jgi:hypothetical protein